MKVMKWPFGTLGYKRFQLGLLTHRLEGLDCVKDARFAVEIKWKGARKYLGSHFRRHTRRHRTNLVASTGPHGIVQWQEEFENVCSLQMAKEGGFQSFDVGFVILKDTSSGSKPNITIVGASSINLADIVPPSCNGKHTMKVPVLCCNEDQTLAGVLVVTFSFVELRTLHDGTETLYRIRSPSISSCIRGNMLWARDDFADENNEIAVEISTCGNGERFSWVYFRDEKSSPTSETSHFSDDEPSGSDSVDEVDVNPHNEDGKLHSFSYGSIAEANLVLFSKGYEDNLSAGFVKFSNANVDLYKCMKDLSADSDQFHIQSSVSRILSWRKRKFGLRSPWARGEPLLNKAYGEDGGDEIDWDRRQHTPVGSLLSLPQEQQDVVNGLDFGETFTVGSWIRKELTSRDGQMKLSTSLFFASIDQCSEIAAGEGACTALVAVIADWLHRYPNLMPTKAEFDMMIRDGSAEWRKLCEKDDHKELFPDLHFDLDTVLKAAVRPLCVVPEKSFIGFFQPDGLVSSWDFLQEAMSFDKIWDEIQNDGPGIYIISWNDHFFILKMEQETCYIIDTLGERLYEGCSQAYIVKFDDSTHLHLLPTDGPGSPTDNLSTSTSTENRPENAEHEECSSKRTDEDVITRGKSACREFVKGFLAALPLRELQSDITKGLAGKLHLHKRLQIEFHFTMVQP